MQHDLPEPGSPADWLRHAASDLDLAKVDRTPAILLESLCFHTQQATEKALKAVLIAQGVAYPKTHNVRTLLDLLPQDLSVPPDVDSAAGLTDYAVLSRYPAEVEPVTETEYRDAIRMAESVLSWARGLIR